MNIQLQEIKNIFIKNRLTEGVDFVRKEWLKGDNTAYFEWSVNLWNNQLHTIIGKDKKNFIASRFKTPNPTESAFQIAYNSNPASHGVDYLMTIFRSENNAYYIADIVPYSSMPDVVDFKFYINNSVGYCVRNNELFTGHNMATAWNDNVKFIINGGKMKLLEEYDSVNDKLISSLVPCQLLKSIPATLDANNIARSAGECGMYDSVSGKFYGNVASTGTFTVEGDVEPETHSGLQQIYQNKLIEGVDYETYDWLKADIPLNVTMMELSVNSNNVEYDLQRLAHGNTTIFKTKNDEYKYFFWQNGYTIGVYDLKGYRDVTSKSYDSTISLFHIKTTPNSVAFNSVSIGAFGLPITNILWQVNSGSNSDTTKTSSIKVDGVTRYVPCKLLRSIPRNLDAQCKERQAGECGMVDLISGKFYGNIANSGTFTVENDTENN